MHVMLGDGVELGQLVVDDLRKVYVLHRVLYPQVHDNGLKKKKKNLASRLSALCSTLGLTTASSGHRV